AHASASQDFPRYVKERYGKSGARVFVLGHWGLQYYGESAGFREFDTARDDIRRGDLFILASYNTNENFPEIMTTQLPNGDQALNALYFHPIEPAKCYSNPWGVTTVEPGRALLYGVIVPQIPYAWVGPTSIADCFTLIEALKEFPATNTSQPVAGPSIEHP